MNLVEYDDLMEAMRQAGVYLLRKTTEQITEVDNLKQYLAHTLEQMHADIAAAPRGPCLAPSVRPGRSRPGPAGLRHDLSGFSV
jgi:hypothetical protein